MDNMVSRNRLAVIPARGGSQRLPRKNLIDFLGRPLIAWTIEAARESAVFDRLIVSTEDAEIADVARSLGADVPFLRSEHFDHHSNISDVTAHVIEQAERHLGETFAVVATLQCTCPLRDSVDIRAALAAFDASGADFQMSCFRFPWLNPWWAFERDALGHATWLHPEMLGRRSQDQPPVFGLTGAILVAKVEAFRRFGSFYGPGQRFEPISWMAAIDIDDEEDLSFARAAALSKARRSA
jgi:N-acylneuraminate cytidylyltransferase